MKQISTLLFVLAFSLSFGQSFITPKLQQKIGESAANDKVHIRIEFTDKVDCFELKKQFIIAKLPVSERPKQVILALQNQAKISQTPLLNFFKAHTDEVSNIEPFWIVNSIVCDVEISFLPQLTSFSGISLIDYENNTILLHEDAKATIVEQSKIIGAPEPGLIDINAAPLWHMGYTGRGRLVYNYDTGVWPTHPAFTGRFIGNYKPMSQSWHGFLSQIPNGDVDSHGTHTLGTILGLDTITHDTIGVAFNAYFMANDFVATTVQALAPLSAMMEAFQWALNPDGDINTSDDVPDVISNSWRWYDGDDTTQCGGIEVDLMNAIEAAGIANVFAGGNMGPNNTTVSAPQRINTSEVNVFSVGAVDGNHAFPYPISDFSSRGPKQCPGTGSLLIHPEVVAPGQNVRSSYGTNQYAVLSGTSMATPHVSGAILLLKEAFPYLAGEDFLWALYLTAVDLGVPGEDNTYGMGMIDVYAAYQYLASTNTPIDPTIVPYDLAVGINQPVSGYSTCDSVFVPEIYLANKGTSSISAVTIYYSLNGAGEMTQNWSGTLNQNQQTTITLPSLTSHLLGDNELTVRVEIDGQPTEYDLYNNQHIIRFNVRPVRNVPYWESFENDFSNGDWIVNNPDTATTWEVLKVANTEGGDYAAAIKMGDYTPSHRQKDQLISPKINIPAAQSATLAYDWAYFRWSHSPVKEDTLSIIIKTDCESTVLGTIYAAAGDSLQTSDSLVVDFEPTKASDWKTKTLDISAFEGQQISIVFESTNHNGDNLFIDNVKVYSGNNQPLGIIANKLDDILLFPNPNSGEFTLQIPSELIDKSSKIILINTLGKEEYQQLIVNEKTKISILNLANGLYIVKVLTRNGEIQKRIIKE